jgi:hypothetical protein
MSFTKIGISVTAGYFLAAEGIDIMLQQIALPDVINSDILELLISRGSTVVVLAVGLWFSWRHHIYTLKYYRTRLEAKDVLIAVIQDEKNKVREERNKVIAQKDEEIKRLYEKLSDKK